MIFSQISTKNNTDKCILFIEHIKAHLFSELLLLLLLFFLCDENYHYSSSFKTKLDKYFEYEWKWENPICSGSNISHLIKQTTYFKQLAWKLATWKLRWKLLMLKKWSNIIFKINVIIIIQYYYLDSGLDKFCVNCNWMCSFFFSFFVSLQKSVQSMKFGKCFY